jgi:hypothetical protein
MSELVLREKCMHMPQGRDTAALTFVYRPSSTVCLYSESLVARATRQLYARLFPLLLRLVRAASNRTVFIFFRVVRKGNVLYVDEPLHFIRYSHGILYRSMKLCKLHKHGILRCNG